MKKLFCIILALALPACTFAVGESAAVERQDGQVYFMLPENTFTEACVTPFSARAYRFADSERIAELFFGDADYSIDNDIDNEGIVRYTSGEESLTVSTPQMDAQISFDSEYTTTVFTPIPLITDIYAMRDELEDEDAELSFMSRAEAEAEVERFAGEIYEGLNFQCIANFAITRSDYEASYERRREELDALIGSDDKTTQDMRAKADFPQEDLGYLIGLAQEINGLPVTWSFFQNVRDMPRNLEVDFWVFWTPYGCKYFRSVIAVEPLANEAPCEVLLREQAMDAFAEGYNYVLGAREVEVWDAQLVWFTDQPEIIDTGDIATSGNIAGEIHFRPMWCMYTPKYYSYYDDSAFLELGFYVDARTGETWV